MAQALKKRSKPIKFKIMQTIINTSTEKRRLELYSNFNKSKRTQWSNHRRFTFQY